MSEVNQTPESPQVPEAIGEKVAPEALATPELGGVFKAGSSKKPMNPMLWVYIALAVIIVAGGGYFAWAKYSDQILIKLGVKEATPATTTDDTATDTDTTATTTDETADWKTYTNSSLGLSLKYPDTWETTTFFNRTDSHVLLTLVTSENAMTIKNKTADQILEITPDFELTYYNSAADLLDKNSQKSNSTSLINYLTTQKAISDSPVINYAAKKIGTFDGYSVEQPNIGGVSYYYFEHLGKVYQIAFNTGSETIIDKIAGTIKFADPTADWKTYEVSGKWNYSGKYSFNYPSNYQITIGGSSDLDSYILTTESGNKLLGFDLRPVGLESAGATLSESTGMFNSNKATVKTYTKNGATVDRFIIFDEGVSLAQYMFDSASENIIQSILATFRFIN